MTKTNLNRDHPLKMSENKAPESLDVWTFYLGDWLGEKAARLHNRYEYSQGRVPPPNEPEIIRYNKDNTNC